MPTSQNGDVTERFEMTECDSKEGPKLSGAPVGTEAKSGFVLN